MHSTGLIIPSLKATCLLSLYIILPSFIKIGQELFEIIDIKTDTHTDRHIHAGENNTCPKTKFLGQVKMPNNHYDEVVEVIRNITT